MNFNNKNPIYMQIINKIRNDIAAGILKSGDKLPSVRQMSEQLKVNPNTILRTFRELELRGITYTQRGTGTFITEDNQMIKEIKQSVIDDLVKNYIIGMKQLNLSDKEILSAIKKNLGSDDNEYGNIKPQ